MSNPFIAPGPYIPVIELIEPMCAWVDEVGHIIDAIEAAAALKAVRDVSSPNESKQVRSRDGRAVARRP